MAERAVRRVVVRTLCPLPRDRSDLTSVCAEPCQVLRNATQAARVARGPPPLDDNPLLSKPFNREWEEDRKEQMLAASQRSKEEAEVIEGHEKSKPF